MHFGFTIIRQKKESKDLPIYAFTQKLSFKYSGKSGSSYHFHYHQNDRFIKDNLFFNQDSFIGGIDGVILNLNELKKSYTISDWQALFISLYKKYQANFADQFYGEFSGFIFDKDKEELICFTNHCASKKVYFHHSDDFSVISASIASISDFLKSTGNKIKLDTISAYSLLTYGGNFGTSTLIEGVFRLHGGTYLSINQNQLSIKKYFDYNAIKNESGSEKYYIDQLEEQFQIALKQEYEKDIEYGLQHFATLSGGLDSRMNVMLAEQMGYKITNLCFSQTGYDDERIARSISKHLDQDLIFVALDEGKYILDYEENLNLYEGQIFYTTSAHFNYAMKKIDTKPYGLIHTGLLGDGFLGSLLSSPKPSPPIIKSKLISGQLFPLIENEMKELAKKYRTDDVFQIHQRGFNVAISGCWAMEQYSYLVSPFMNPDFIRTCLRMPVHYKYQQNIYIKWINRHHKELTNFKWEATGMRPLYTWQRTLSRFTKKAKALSQRLQGMPGLSMTPYFYWYENVPEIKVLIDRVFEEKINHLDGDQRLKTNVTNLFQTGNVVEKILVMTLLGAIEKLNISV